MINEIIAILRGFIYFKFRGVAGLLRVYGGIEIIGKAKFITFGKRCKINKGVVFDVRENLGEPGIILGEKVVIERDVILKQHGGKIEIHDNSFIGIRSIIQGKGCVKVGKDVMFGPYVQIYSSDHEINNKNVSMRESGENSGPVIIGDNIWIGAGSTILKGSVIGCNSVVAAGTIIRGNISQGAIHYNKRILCKKDIKQHV